MRNKAVYLALGIAADGTKDVLGIWIEQKEGAKFWLKVMNELRNRGVDPDSGSGGHYHRLPVSQRADLHRTFNRYCLSFCGWKERQALARELKGIYRAEIVEAAAKRFSEFEAGSWGKKYPMIAESWRRNWQQIIPFYGYPKH